MPTKLLKSERPKQTEAQLVRLCLDWLRAEKILAWRNNTGAMKGSYKGKPWFVRFGRPGLPDIIAVTTVDWFYNGVFVGIECKTDTGKQSPEQCEFQKELEEAGGTYLLVRSLEDLKRGLSHDCTHLG